MILLCLLAVGWIFGQIFSISCCSGVRVSLLDLAVFFFITASFFQKKWDRKSAIWYLKTFTPFIAVALLSLIFQLPFLPLLKIGISSLYLLRFIFYSLLLLIILNQPQFKNKLLLFLWMMGMSIVVVGLLQYFLYPNLRNLAYLGWDPHEFRLFSTFLDPNFTGIILVLTLILGCLYIYPSFLKWRWVIVFSLFFNVLALLLTYSRGSFMALFAVLLAGGVFKKKYWQTLLSILLLTIFIFLLPRPNGEGVNLFRTLSISSRLENNAEAWDLFLTSPIFGVGFDTLRFTRILPDTSADNEFELNHSSAGFHNSWLFILATSGLLGLASYLWIWYRLNAAANPKFKTLLLLTFLVVGFHSLFDNSLFYPQVMTWMWIVSAVSVSCSKSS